MLFCIFLALLAAWNPCAAADLGKTNVGECGRSNIPFNDVQGKPIPQKAFVGKMPWSTMTFSKTSGDWQPLCLGVLISPRAVLTVAHCVICSQCKSNAIASDLVVVLGKGARNWNTSEPTEIKKKVKEIRAHPHFHGIEYSYINDIALLILEDDVKASTAVMPACLDSLNEHTADISAKNVGFVTSWGRSGLDNNVNNCSRGEEQQQTYSRLTVQDFLTCFNTIKSINQQAAQAITPDKICSDLPLCSGDSGASLTFMYNDSHYLYGIASNVLRLNSKEGLKPYSLYTDLSYHMDWIKKNLI